MNYELIWQVPLVILILVTFTAAILPTYIATFAIVVDGFSTGLDRLFRKKRVRVLVNPAMATAVILLLLADHISRPSLWLIGWRMLLGAILFYDTTRNPAGNNILGVNPCTLGCEMIRDIAELPGKLIKRANSNRKP